jgi:hypothetical protein
MTRRQSKDVRARSRSSFAGQGRTPNVGPVGERQNNQHGGKNPPARPEAADLRRRRSGFPSALTAWPQPERRLPAASPAPIELPARFDTMPSRPSSRALANTITPSGCQRFAEEDSTDARDEPEERPPPAWGASRRRGAKGSEATRVACALVPWNAAHCHLSSTRQAPIEPLAGGFSISCSRCTSVVPGWVVRVQSSC